MKYIMFARLFMEFCGQGLFSKILGFGREVLLLG